MYFDTHTHLNDDKLYQDFDNLIDQFKIVWWIWLINSWVNDLWNERAIKISKVYDKKDFYCKSTIWYHPIDCNDFDKNNSNRYYEKLYKLYMLNKDFIVWIWECWIDMHYESSKNNLKKQKNFFDMQCWLAKFLDLPIIIHSRDDFDSTIDVLKSYKNEKIYFHCFWYWIDQIELIDKLFTNYRIWICWNVSYPKAEILRNSLKKLSIENLFIESDAPYLPPQFFRWKLNFPHYIPYLYDFISNFLQIDIDKLKIQIKNNFESFF